MEGKQGEHPGGGKVECVVGPGGGQWVGTPLLGQQLRILIVNRSSRGEEMPLSHVLRAIRRGRWLGTEKLLRGIGGPYSSFSYHVGTIFYGSFFGQTDP